MVWGTGFVAQKIGGNLMPPMSFNATRLTMGSLVLLPLMAYSLKKSGYFSAALNSEEQLANKRRRILRGGVICGFFMIVGVTLQQVGLMTISTGKSGFISSIYIVFVLIFNVFFGQKVTGKAIICTALALFGFAVMSLSGDITTVTKGDWLTLLSAVFIAFQIHFVDRYVDEDNSIVLSVLELGIGGIAGLIFAVAVERPEMSQFIGAIPVLLYTTLVPTAIGYTCQFVGQKYTEPSLASMIMSTEAVFAALFGMIILGEMMSAREIAGSVIIFIAIIAGQMEPRKE